MGKIKPLVIEIMGTNLHVSASVAVLGRSVVSETILYPTFPPGLTLPQAREMVDALVRCVSWCEKQGARGKGLGGVDTQYIPFEGDNPMTIQRKLLMATDDSLFCVGRRVKRAWGLYSHPFINIEEWDIDEETYQPVALMPNRYIPVNCPAAMQVAVTLGKVVKMCEGWK